MNTAIWWIRRDLRLGDNQALAEALRQANTVIPIFILDPKLLNSAYVGQPRSAFLYEGLRALVASLRERGSALIIREGDPLEQLSILTHETSAEGIFAEADNSPYANQRDQRVASKLPLKLLPGVTVFPAEFLRKADGSPYTVFTPFSRMWLSLPLPSNPNTSPPTLTHRSSLEES